MFRMSDLSNNHTDSRRWFLPCSVSKQYSCEIDSLLLQLPREVLECVLLKLDAISLLHLAQTCSAFTRKEQGGLTIIEATARRRVRQIIGAELSERFR